MRCATQLPLVGGAVLQPQPAVVDVGGDDRKRARTAATRGQYRVRVVDPELITGHERARTAYGRVVNHDRIALRGRGVAVDFNLGPRTRTRVPVDAQPLHVVGPGQLDHAGLTADAPDLHPVVAAAERIDAARHHRVVVLGVRIVPHHQPERAVVHLDVVLEVDNVVGCLRTQVQVVPVKAHGRSAVFRLQRGAALQVDRQPPAVGREAAVLPVPTDGPGFVVRADVVADRAFPFQDALLVDVVLVEHQAAVR